MPKVAVFISELVRAANEVEKLGDFEKYRLLERGVNSIRDMRELTSDAGSMRETYPVTDIQTVAAMTAMGQATNDQIRAALLDAANLMRTLKIMLDGE